MHSLIVWLRYGCKHFVRSDDTMPQNIVCVARRSLQEHKDQPQKGFVDVSSAQCLGIYNESHPRSLGGQWTVPQRDCGNLSLNVKCFVSEKPLLFCIIWHQTCAICFVNVTRTGTKSTKSNRIRIQQNKPNKCCHQNKWRMMTTPKAIFDK